MKPHRLTVTVPAELARAVHQQARAEGLRVPKLLENIIRKTIKTKAK